MKKNNVNDTTNNDEMKCGMRVERERTPKEKGLTSLFFFFQ
jgi:hypothetical protein